MSVLNECPLCHRQQSPRNKTCGKCGADLDKQKRNSRVRYYVTNRIDGKPKKEFIGYSWREAKAVDGKRKTQIREGRAREIRPNTRMTFKELSDWFLAEKEEDIRRKERAQERGKNRKGMGRGYQKRVMSALNSFNKVFGGTQTGDITYQKLLRYIEGREDNDKISPYTIDIEMAIIKSMISDAFDENKVDAWVFKIFRKVETIAMPEDKRRKRVITIDEYRKLLSATQQHPLHGMLVIGMVTGMRPSEIRKLRWSYIDNADGMIFLPGKITKNKKARSIPLCRQVREVLDGLSRYPHDFVITDKKRPIESADWIKREMKKVCQNAILPYGEKNDGLLFKDLRRSAKTNMLKAGIAKEFRDLILGHTLPGMDENYISERGLVPEFKKAMGTYDSWLSRQMEKTKVAQNVA